MQFLFHILAFSLSQHLKIDLLGWVKMDRLGWVKMDLLGWVKIDLLGWVKRPARLGEETCQVG